MPARYLVSENSQRLRFLEVASLHSFDVNRWISGNALITKSKNIQYSGTIVIQINSVTILGPTILATILFVKKNLCAINPQSAIRNPKSEI